MRTCKKGRNPRSYRDRDPPAALPRLRARFPGLASICAAAWLGPDGRANEMPAIRPAPRRSLRFRSKADRGPPTPHGEQASVVQPGKTAYHHAAGPRKAAPSHQITRSGPALTETQPQRSESRGLAECFESRSKPLPPCSAFIAVPHNLKRRLDPPSPVRFPTAAQADCASPTFLVAVGSSCYRSSWLLACIRAPPYFPATRKHAGCPLPCLKRTSGPPFLKSAQ